MKMGRDSWLKPATWAQMKTEVGRRGQVAGFAGIRSQAHSYKTTEYRVAGHVYDEMVKYQHVKLQKDSELAKRKSADAENSDCC